MPLFAYALKSTLILIAAAVLALALGRRSAASRHLVWTAAAVGLLALPFLTWLLPALRVPVAMASEGPGVVFRALAVGQAGDAGEAAALASAPPAASPTGGAPLAHSALPWLALIWGAGSVFVLWRLLAAWMAVRRMRRAARPFADEAYAASLAECLGLDGPVEILECGAGAMPMTCGIFRPAVLLPAGAGEWSAARLRVVLLHELAHVRRGDVATHLLARLAFCLNWWNPLAWFAWRQTVKEGERATDDLVLTAGERASDYAGQLLEIARGFQARPATAWAALAMARSSQMEGRLRAILDTGVNRRPAGRMAPLAAALTAIVLAAPFAAIQAGTSHTKSIPQQFNEIGGKFANAKFAFAFFESRCIILAAIWEKKRISPGPLPWPCATAVRASPNVCLR